MLGLFRTRRELLDFAQRFFNLVDLPSSSMDLKIYNAIGETVMNKKITIASSGETKINLGGKADGIYLFEVKTSEGTITKKVVINR